MIAVTPESATPAFDADPRGMLLRLQESLTAELESTHEALLEVRRLRADPYLPGLSETSVRPRGVTL
jgi:hypothetical protein